jgi:ATP-dependent Clp protease protease subunit
LGRPPKGALKLYIFYLNLRGELVSDGISLFNYFSGFPLELHIYNTGSVASVAVTSFLGVNRRYASAHATFMIHRTRLINAPAPGYASQHRTVADFLETEDARTEAIIRSRAQIPEDRWAAQEINDVTITAQEALQFGIVQEIREFRPAAGDQIFNI